MIAAAAEAGIRITLLDACYLDGGLHVVPGRKRRGMGGAGRGARGRWPREARRGHPQPPCGRSRQRGLGGRALRPDRGWVLHAHVSEQARENEECEARYGATPVQALARAGALCPSGSRLCTRPISVTPMPARSGMRGAFVCMCPTTERDLADGIGLARRAVDARRRLAVGDRHLRGGAGGRARRAARERCPRAVVGGGAAHRGDGRWLRKSGVVDRRRDRGWGACGPRGGAPRRGPARGAPCTDAVTGAIFAATAADVSDVIVDGQFVVRDDGHVSIDVAGELEAVLAQLSSATTMTTSRCS